MEDVVRFELEVTDVAVTSGSGNCEDLRTVGNVVDCTIYDLLGVNDLETPEDDTTAIITVSYTAAPALPEYPIHGTATGDEFRFIFVNGSILEGSTDGGPVYLDGANITEEVTLIADLNKNDILFDPPGDDPAFLMHLSCSDRFIGGWGESDGPDRDIDVNWQIASYSITRYNQNGFLKACGDTPVPFMVDNKAEATGRDSNGDVYAYSMAMVKIVDPSLVFPEDDFVDFKNSDVYFKFVSKNPENMLITQVEISWPENVNGALTEIQLGRNTIWTGNEAGPTAVIFEADFTGFESDRILEALQKEKLRFSFENRTVADPDSVEYTFVVTFADGTDVSITSAGSEPPGEPPGNMYIWDLLSETSLAKGNKWNAIVTVTVHDESEGPLAGATVLGAWEGAATGSGSCVTDVLGKCAITINSIRGDSITFTVTDVTHAAYEYDPDMNIVVDDSLTLFIP